MEFARWLLATGVNYPDLVAILLGTAAGYAVGILAETYLIPATMPARQQQGLTVLITIVVAWLLSFLIWGTMDPADSATMRALISIAASVLAVFTYPLVGRIATKYFPSIGSIWAVKP